MHVITDVVRRIRLFDSAALQSERRQCFSDQTLRIMCAHPTKPCPVLILIIEVSKHIEASSGIQDIETCLIVIF